MRVPTGPANASPRRVGIANHRFRGPTALKAHWGKWAISGYLAIALLALATWLAYSNAWPNALVHDDKFFAGGWYPGGWADIPQFFMGDLWAGSGVVSGLYRPLLLTSLALESRFYGDWYAGYHLDNILLHLSVVIVLYGFLRQFARSAGETGTWSDVGALLAALVFAVHPVHTEAVNSLFNRSEMMVALAGIGGLWWFLRFLRIRPALAWLGLSLCYLLGLFSRETAILLPAIAVVLVLTLEPEPWPGRLRKCLPALWLLLPLALYLVLRAQALEPPASEGGQRLGAMARTVAMIAQAQTPRVNSLLVAAGIWGQSLSLFIWPDPLLLYHPLPSKAELWTALVVQVALLATAVIRFRAGRPSLLAGLLFFYLALLPASRILGIWGPLAVLAERYLYLAAAGLAVCLAAAFRWLGQRSRWLAIVPALVVLMLLTPQTGARNEDWASELALFESEYRNGSQGPDALRLLSAAYIRAGQHGQAASMCDSHRYDRWGANKFANHCGIAYARLGRIADAERAYLAATRGRWVDPSLYANLGRFYLQHGRREEAREQFERAVRAERTPEMRAYRRGHMLVMLYPRNRQKLNEARDQFAEAVRIQPRLAAAQSWLDRLDRTLGAH